jgi:hypothetical protein
MPLLMRVEVAAPIHVPVELEVVVEEEEHIIRLMMMLLSRAISV